MPQPCPVNLWQQVLYDLCFVLDLVNPKVLEHKLHRARSFISDICRRERVDPLPVFNVILRDAEALIPTDPVRAFAIAQPIMALMIADTGWFLEHNPPVAGAAVNYNRLCEQAGTLCKTLGGTIESLARIEADGVVNQADDPEIAKCLTHIEVLRSKLRLLSVELRRRRAVESRS
ncbi:MAG: hypothetical protein IID41_14485 [Planctomycetes bacterium]|nr:hypothetical protein [Planctomycetota bacterium]